MSMLERNGIIAGGTWVLDHTKIIDFFPAQDALANVLAETSSNGGGPYNVLIDLARLGAPFPLGAVGVLGDDAPGRHFRDDCHKHDIATRHLHLTKQGPT